MNMQQIDTKWIPRDDTFGARLALVRQRFGWNQKEASLACGLPQNSWLEWETNGRAPRDLTLAAEKISSATGADEYWLMTGRVDPVLPSSPLTDSNRRPPLYIVGGSSLADAAWPDEEPKRKIAA